ncbi:hypothetical protein B0H14DRAFT_2640132 [Mycena olivaceomarginata]|nr:hypothetical protein B0H14DRAFT_2640132 [Mycena olivaceomarginata]
MAESPHSEAYSSSGRGWVNLRLQSRCGDKVIELRFVILWFRKSEIFESSLMNRDIGAAVTIQANAMWVLEYLGYEERNLKGVKFSGSGGEGQTNLFLIPRNYMGRAGWLCHRTALQNELKQLGVGEDGAGPPVKLNLGQEVASCDPVTRMLTSKNDGVHRADLIIGADSIHDSPPRQS